MNCGCSNHSTHQSHPHVNHQGCGCGGHAGKSMGMWSTKKKIRFLEGRLEELNEQKTDIKDLIDELKSGK